MVVGRIFYDGPGETCGKIVGAQIAVAKMSGQRLSLMYN